MILDSPVGFPQIVVDIPQIAQRVALPPPVADLAGDGKVLFVRLDGPAGFAQVIIGNPQVAEVRTFGLFILNVPGGG